MYPQPRMSMPSSNNYYNMPSSSASSSMQMAAQQQQQQQQQRQQPLPHTSFDPYPATTAPAVNLPPSHRPSSGAWTVQDDQQLMQARAQGLNWTQIKETYFPSKTPNACRKRHERLAERRDADDWDTRKFQRLAKEYMSMRKEIWTPLAARTGEKWSVVEQKVLKAPGPPFLHDGDAADNYSACPTGSRTSKPRPVPLRDTRARVLLVVLSLGMTTTAAFPASA